jgi:hypothetical protein
VSYGAAPAVEPSLVATVATATDPPSASGTASLPPRRGGWTWAQLMQRAFDVDVICRACGGRVRLIATILDPGTIRAMLLAMGLVTEAADRAPPDAHRA